MALTNLVSTIRQFESRRQAWIWLLLAIICAVWSPKIASYPWTRPKATGAVLVIAVLAVIPSCSPHVPINLRQMMREDFYSILKTAGSLIFFNLFKWIADEMMVADDIWICATGICFFMYVLAVDVEFGVEDDLGFCDGLLFAIYGTILNEFQMRPEKKSFFISSGLQIPAWLLHSVFSSLLLFKNLKFAGHQPVVAAGAALQPTDSQQSGAQLNNMGIVVNHSVAAAPYSVLVAAAPYSVLVAPAPHSVLVAAEDVAERVADGVSQNPKKWTKWASMICCCVLFAFMLGRPNL